MTKAPNYIDWKSNIKLDPSWTPPVDKDFIPHILPILASIQLVSNPDNGLISPKLTYNNIPDNVKTPNGNVPGEQIKALIGFTAICRRSLLLPKTTQTKYPQYGIYTPLVLYAHKLYNNVPYNKWDKTPSPYLHAFLGTTLYEAYAVTRLNGKPELDVANLRKEALTYKSGIKAGTQDKATAHRCNLLGLNVKARDGNITKKKYTKYAVMSYLQLWISNAELRNTDAMILDLLDWDNVPKAIDAVIAKPREVKEKTSVDELWDIL